MPVNSNIRNGKLVLPKQWADTTNNRIYYTSGNVGINTNNPSYNLSINGTTSTNILLADNISFNSSNIAITSSGIINNVTRKNLLGIDLSENIVVPDQLIADTVFVKSDLIVEGSVTTLNSVNHNITNNLIGINDGLSSVKKQNTNNKKDSGVIIYRAGNKNGFIGIVENNDMLNSTNNDGVFLIGYTDATTKLNGNFKKEKKTIIPGLVYADISGSNISKFNDLTACNIVSSKIENTGDLSAKNFVLNDGTMNDVSVSSLQISKSISVNESVSIKNTLSVDEDITAGNNIKGKQITGETLYVSSINSKSINLTSVKSIDIEADSVDSDKINAEEINVSNKLSSANITSSIIKNANRIDTSALYVKEGITADIITSERGIIKSLVVNDSISGVKIIGCNSIKITELLTSNGIKSVDIEASNKITSNELHSANIFTTDMISKNHASTDIKTQVLNAETSSINVITSQNINSTDVNATSLSSDKLTCQTAEINAVTTESINNKSLITSNIKSSVIDTDKIVSKDITFDKIAGKDIKTNTGTANIFIANDINVKSINIKDTCDFKDITGQNINGENIVTNTLTIPGKLEILNTNKMIFNGDGDFNSIICKSSLSALKANISEQLDVGGSVVARGSVTATSLNIVGQNTDSHSGTANVISGDLNITNNLSTHDIKSRNINCESVVATNVSSKSFDTSVLKCGGNIDCSTLNVTDTVLINNTLTVKKRIDADDITALTSIYSPKLESSNNKLDNITSVSITNAGLLSSTDIKSANIEVSSRINTNKLDTIELITENIKTISITSDKHTSNNVEAELINAKNIVSIEGKINKLETVSIMAEETIKAHDIVCINGVESKTGNFASANISALETQTLNSVSIKTDDITSTKIITNDIQSNTGNVNNLVSKEIKANSIKCDNIELTNLTSSGNITTNELQLNKLNTKNIDCESIKCSADIKCTSIEGNNGTFCSLNIDEANIKNLHGVTMDIKTINGNDITAKTFNCDNINSKGIITESVNSHEIVNITLTNENVNTNNVNTKVLTTDQIIFRNPDSARIDLENIVCKNIESASISVKDMLNCCNVRGKSLIIDEDIICNRKITCENAEFTNNITVIKDIYSHKVACILVNATQIESTDIKTNTFNCAKNISAGELTVETNIVSKNISIDDVVCNNNLTSKSATISNVKSQEIDNESSIKTNKLQASTVNIYNSLTCDGDNHISGSVLVGKELTTKGAVNIGASVVIKGGITSESGIAALKELELTNNAKISGGLYVGKKLEAAADMSVQNITCKNINCADINALNYKGVFNNIQINEANITFDDDKLTFNKGVVAQDIWINNDKTSEYVNINPVIDIANTRFLDTIDRIKIKQITNMSTKQYCVIPDELNTITDLKCCVKNDAINYNSLLGYQIVGLQYMNAITKNHKNELLRIEGLHNDDSSEINKLKEIIKHNYNDYNTRIISLKEENTKYHNRYIDLTTKNDSLIEHNNKITEENEKLVKKIESLEKIITSINNNIDDIKEHVGI